MELIYLTKKEFKTALIVAEFLVFFGLIAGFVLITNHYNKNKLTPEISAELDEWRRVSIATQRLVSEDLWSSSTNEAALLAETLEADKDMSIYTQYQLNDDSVYESIVIAGKLDSLKNKHERDLLKEKLNNTIATTNASKILAEYEPVVSGIILNWKSNGETFALIDINGDGSWDYVTKGEDAHFSEEGSNLVYTDDVGHQTFVQSGEAIELFSPHFTLSEAERMFG